MFDDIIKEIQKFNSKANWSNLASGIILLLILAGGTLWFFTKNGSNRSTNDVLNVENLGTGGTKETLGESKSEDLSDKTDASGAPGTGGSNVQVLPNTSSK
ncbi:hypothetical protein HY419_00805 [candidate division WWE3 bacterium]|nr:hypothetical protein [candidate division WWE3 bacterium]